MMVNSWGAPASADEAAAFDPVLSVDRLAQDPSLNRFADRAGKEREKAHAELLAAGRKQGRWEE